ncbi:MAG: invasion associated locus B family protein [Pseudomonadota bacterium]
MSVFKTAALALGMAFGLTANVSAQQAENLPRGEWFKVCSKQADNDICNVQNIRTAQTGQLLTAVNLIQITGKDTRRLFQVAVPTGRVIPAGVALQIDGGEARRINYAICLPDRCIAEAPLTDELVSAMKRGGSMRLTTVNFQQQRNPIDVTLSGFTAAFDGEPLQASELQTRQQELQAEIEKRREEFQEKLKAEQEKAKQGN